MSAFRHVWPDSWGPRIDYILTNAVRALLDVPGARLLMLPRLLIDDPFRTNLIDRHLGDPVVRAFLVNEYAGNERFNRTLQDEFIAMGHMTIDSQEFNRQLTEWLVEYNFKRPHQTLNYNTPMNYAYRYSPNLVLPMSPSSTID